MVSPSRSTRPWLLLPALLAVLWFLPTLWHGFRSDDFLTVYYYDRDEARVFWDRVFGEWARPWFGVRDLYRPFVSLTFGANWAASTSPAGFHALNVALLSITAAAIAAAAARLVKTAPRAAALLAGAVVVLHPAAVEPTAWIAARTTGLQVCWSALAYATFLRWRDGEGRLVWPLLATAFACTSKEGAVLLPASFLALDLLRGSRPHWRTHLPFALLVGGYLLWRQALLGVLTTAEEGHTLLERARGAWALLAQLAAPPSAEGWAGPVVLASTAGLALFAAIAALRSLVCLPWAFLLLSPGTTHVQVAGGELAGRFVFDAAPALALLAAFALGGQRIALRPLAGLAALALLTALGFAGHAHLAGYTAQDREIGALQAQLQVQAQSQAQTAEAAGAPFGVVGLPRLPLLQPGLWGFLAQRPFVGRDLSVVGLDHVLTKDPAAANVFADATAISVLATDGAGCAGWNSGAGALTPLPRGRDGASAFVPVDGFPGRFVASQRLPSTAAQMLEVVAPGPVRQWQVAVLGNLEGPLAQAPFAADTGAGPPRPDFWCDTSGVLGWVVATQLGGGVAGVEVTCDGRPAPAGTVVRAHARPTVVPVPAGGATSVDRTVLASRIRLPATPGAPWQSLYLLLPTGVHRLPVSAEGRVELDAEAKGQLGFASDVLGPCRVHWFATAPGGAGQKPARTTFGTCIVR